mmetsp:Transcript_52823/g.114164  ORF Transcript_52823/g.114164 Transcript_52823/m.114164 type:complete len:526 (+) Transcript_52823:49-1626(+)
MASGRIGLDPARPAAARAWLAPSRSGQRSLASAPREAFDVRGGAGGCWQLTFSTVSGALPLGLLSWQLFGGRLGYHSGRLSARRRIIPRSCRAEGNAGNPAPSTGIDTAGPAVWPSLMLFVGPAYALVVTNMILTAVDKAFVGRISSVQLAALGPAAAVFDCCSYLLTFLNTATLSLLGSSPSNEKSRVRSHALIFSVALGAMLGALMLLQASPAVRLVGASQQMLPYSILYLQIRALGSPIDRMGSVATQFCLAEKDGITPMLATLIAAVFNAVGDYLLCPRYGLGGAAIATVAASATSLVFIVYRLRLKGLWPALTLPGLEDLKPFTSFAGLVFLILLLKITSFTVMTGSATVLGTAPAAAHQVLVSVLFVAGIAFGQPLSWAAQSFLPGATKQPERRRTEGALVAVSLVFMCLGILVAGLLASNPSIFTQDLPVLREVRKAAAPCVAFSALYVAFLALEGVAIAKQRLRACVVIATAVAGGGVLAIWTLRVKGLLTLASLWTSQAALLALGTATAAIVACRR